MPVFNIRSKEKVPGACFVSFNFHVCAVLFLLVELTLFLCSSNIIQNSRRNSFVSATGFVGTYYSRFPAFDNLNLTSIPNEPTSAASNQAFYIHEFEPLPDSAGFTPLPVMMVPICIAYNASTLVGSNLINFDVSLETLGAWMMGTLSHFNTSLSDHSRYAPIGTGQFRLVLARNSPTTRAVLQRMMEEGVAGFTSAIALPAQVLANPNITWVADDFAALDLMHIGDGSATHGLVTFVSLSYGEFLPCASVIVRTDGGRETRITTPTGFADSDPALFSLSPDTYNYTYAVSTGATAASYIAVYPLFGTIFMSYPNDPTCNDGPRSQIAAEFVQKLYTDNVFFARLRKWGMLLPNAQLRRKDIEHVVDSMPCTTFVAALAGGSGIANQVLSPWVLSYYALNRVFIDYDISNSSIGLQGVADHEFGFAVMDEPIAASNAAQTDPVIESLVASNPNLRVFPVSGTALSVIFNIPGVSSLIVPLCSIRSIFNGTITRWSHPIIQAANAQVTMPDAIIVIVADTTYSGATAMFTDGLVNIDKACNWLNHRTYSTDMKISSTWQLHVDMSLDTDVAVKETVLDTPYSMGILSTPAAMADARVEQAWFVNETTSALSYPSEAFILESLNLATINDYASAEMSANLQSGAGYPFFGLNYIAFEDNQADELFCPTVRHGLEFFMWVMTSDQGRSITSNAGFFALPSHLSENGVSKLIDAKCGGLYVFPLLRANTSSFELSKGTIAGIAVGSATFVAILVAAFVFLFKRGKKSSKHAPKDSNVPMAVIFTDIQASTELWSIAPAAMAAALDLHNDVIDRNIDKYSAYKVKTIGDAYMICVKNIENAHELCLAIQRDLYNAEWPSDDIDLAYGEILLDEHSPYQKCNPDGTEIYDLADFTDQKRNIETPLYKNRVNERLFRGLAVRIGMTWGCADPREDPITGAYDYFSSTVNEASRCESAGNGGQVIYSASAISALRDSGCDLTDTNRLAVTSLGKQPLKGIPAPVELYQVLPAEFAGRRFPPLRLDNEGGAMNQQVDEENTAVLAEPHLNSGSFGVRGSKSEAKYAVTSGTLSIPSVEHTDSSLGEDADKALPADFRFARYLARIDRQNAKFYLLLFDTVSSTLAANSNENQRKDIIKKIVSDWRVQDLSTKHHLHFKTELGYEAYWIMRIVQKIAGAIRIKQRKRDPRDDLHGGALLTHSGRGTDLLSGPIFDVTPKANAPLALHEFGASNPLNNSTSTQGGSHGLEQMNRNVIVLRSSQSNSNQSPSARSHDLQCRQHESLGTSDGCAVIVTSMDNNNKSAGVDQLPALLQQRQSHPTLHQQHDPSLESSATKTY